MEKILEMLTRIAALWGAALSTYILVRMIRAEKPNIFVTYGWSYDFDNVGMNDLPKALLLQAVNHSKREVVVNSLCLEIPGFCRITPLFLATKRARNTTHNKYSINKDRLKNGDQIDVYFDYYMLIKTAAEQRNEVATSSSRSLRGFSRKLLFQFVV